MTLIADSGSTKTTWMELESGNMTVTEGLNPHFTTDEQFLAACTAVRKNLQLPTSNIQLFFYGAGCGSEKQRLRVSDLLSKAFGTSDIHVYSDLLGACRATCGDQPGLVGILGTGSNACYYNGHEISMQAPSLGYMLGDHGSANHVGRMLLQDYLTDKMPDDISVMFHDTYTDIDDTWLDAVYHRPHANRYLASLAPFATAHMAEPYCNGCLCGALDDWYCYQLADLVLTSERRELHLIGAFAAAIKPMLPGFCRDNGLTLGRVLAAPIEALRQYHIKNF